MTAKKKKPVKKTLVKQKKTIVVKKAAPAKKKVKIVTKKQTVLKKPIAKKALLKKKVVKKAVSKKVLVKPILKSQSKNKVVASKKSLKVKPLVSKKATGKISAPKTKAAKAEVLINSVVSAQKTVKIGVKTRKQLVPIPPQPIVEVSNHPKTKVKTILISQPKPDNDKNPYLDLAKKYNLIETFRQFIKIEGMPVKDFRNQRIDILEHKAVILTSRMAVDHYFRMCNEMRVTVPESMKYFCINEATAYYLQKYIQYRKRKIFFGHQTIRDLVDVIRKNKEEKFLLPAADVHKEQICEFLDAIGIKYTKAVMYRTVSANLSDIKNLNDFDMLAFFTSAGINSLKQNFPNFKQGNTRIACFGAVTAATLIKHGYRLDIYAPNPKNPSMSGAIDDYIKESNKR